MSERRRGGGVRSGSCPAPFATPGLGRCLALRVLSRRRGPSCIILLIVRITLVFVVLVVLVPAHLLVLVALTHELRLLALRLSFGRTIFRLATRAHGLRDGQDGQDEQRQEHEHGWKASHVDRHRLR